MERKPSEKITTFRPLGESGVGPLLGLTSSAVD